MRIGAPFGPFVFLKKLLIDAEGHKENRDRTNVPYSKTTSTHKKAQRHKTQHLEKPSTYSFDVEDDEANEAVSTLVAPSLLKCTKAHKAIR